MKKLLLFIVLMVYPSFSFADTIFLYFPRYVDCSDGRKGHDKLAEEVTKWEKANPNLEIVSISPVWQSGGGFYRGVFITYREKK